MSLAAKPGRVIWITGLSGSGKTTLATTITGHLKGLNSNVVMLDGDELREVFGATIPSGDNHGREGRLKLALQYSHLCKVLAKQGLIVVIATISMFKEVHRWNREHLPGYYEIFLRVSIEELRHRDPKGIYRRFDLGEITNVAGLDLAVDEPDCANFVIDSSTSKSLEQVADELVKILIERDK